MTFVLATERTREETQSFIFSRLYELSTHAVLTVVDGWSRPIQVRLIRRADDDIHELVAKAAETQPEPREGMVTVYDADGAYVGCMGAETWQRLLADEPLSERVKELEDRLRLACEPCAECGHIDWRELDDILDSGAAETQQESSDAES